MEHLPATNGQPSLAETLSLGKVLAESGYFADARSAAQAVVKILAGREMGFGPVASMADVHIIEGRPSIGAHLMAAAIKRSDKYDYRVLRRDAEACEIQFFERNEKVGVASYTMKEATDSGVALGRDGKLKANWRRHPADMLFARAVSQGYRQFTPDLTGGVLCYSSDDMELDPQKVIEAGPTPAAVASLTVAPEATKVADPTPPLKPAGEAMLLNDEQRNYLADKFKGKSDYAKGLLKLLGLPRYGEVGQLWWQFVRHCADHTPNLEWLAGEVLQGKKLPEMNDEEFQAAQARLLD